MKIAKSVFLFIAAMIFAGCASTGEKPPRYAESVQVVAYDSVKGRPINFDFQVFENTSRVQRPYKVIAALSRNAKPADQGKMLTAIIWRAQHLGADAAIILPPEDGGWEFSAGRNFGIGGSREPIYRAQAIVFTAP